MSVAGKTASISPEVYLEGEKLSQVKLEYVAGHLLCDGRHARACARTQSMFCLQSLDTAHLQSRNCQSPSCHASTVYGFPER